MNWQDPIDFEAGNHGNKPFSIRIPSLVVTRGKNDRLNFLTAMWFTPTGAEPSRMIVAIQKENSHLRLFTGTRRVRHERADR